MLAVTTAKPRIPVARWSRGLEVGRIIPRAWAVLSNFVRGSVTDHTDVKFAVEWVPVSLKGIIQMGMDGTGLDFFLLMSSLSGIIGQVGQANYTEADSFLDASVTYRSVIGLPHTAINVGALEGVGYLSENSDLLEEMKGTEWRSITEKQLLEAFGTASKRSLTPEGEKKSTPGALPIIPVLGLDYKYANQAPDPCDLAAIPLRDDPRNALIIKDGLPYTSLQMLPEGAVVGTSSVRRFAQLRRLLPHLRLVNLRGNVKTRLAKVDDPEGEYTCMVMSACGLEHVGLGHRINQYLGSKDGGILHAAGQGALGLEIRKGDTKTLDLLNQLVDQKSSLTLAERVLMCTLKGGCSIPIGVETEWLSVSNDMLKLRAIVVSLNGSQSVQDAIDVTLQTNDEVTALGQELAARLEKAGAHAILNGINTNRPAKE
ncbi:hypothetical protein DL764_005274 [Monosporascus ibericus]|uniref:hydroxymethylbilane synthase n=1 Tax=Monosporascus ibericus TaxID=155417 RepID=A0A4Q4TD21_9PEZI|nr:hypothetical protein DL764_005274 [Monosporascus ibericus]